MPEGSEVTSGSIERLGRPDTIINWKNPNNKAPKSVVLTSHEEAVNWIAQVVISRIEGPPVAGIGHRIVHGGETYNDSVVITDQVEKGIEALSDLAPLHNPIHLDGIRAAAARFPLVPQVAVFDTAFHQTLPAHAYRYAIPAELYENNAIRRYGFHGTSHRYVSERAAALLETATFTGVTCHLGNGSSLAAIQDGCCIDTSMGLTPMGGIPMGSRSGDLDPAVVLYIQNRLGLTLTETEALLNRKSGLLGLSAISNDLREIEEAAAAGSEKAILAIDVFAYQVAKTMGGYLSILDGAEGIVFTGGIGENAAAMRSRIVDHLTGLQMTLDKGLNEEHSDQERFVSSSPSGLKVMVIPTREEAVIARDTYRLIQEA
jgi:acetate kinase